MHCGASLPVRACWASMDGMDSRHDPTHHSLSELAWTAWIVSGVRAWPHAPQPVWASMDGSGVRAWPHHHSLSELAWTAWIVSGVRAWPHAPQPVEPAELAWTAWIVSAVRAWPHAPQPVWASMDSMDSQCCQGMTTHTTACHFSKRGVTPSTYQETVPITNGNDT